ncbi:MAG: hypothetical protein MK358_12190 [Vicinamibacterales bacterium]|jgi:hypothetical protein|nr:hypothetical protein [Vicinamibacterales bacterium]
MNRPSAWTAVGAVMLSTVAGFLATSCGSANRQSAQGLEEAVVTQDVALRIGGMT